MFTSPAPRLSENEEFRYLNGRIANENLVEKMVFTNKITIISVGQIKSSEAQIDSRAPTLSFNELDRYLEDAGSLSQRPAEHSVRGYNRCRGQTVIRGIVLITLLGSPRENILSFSIVQFIELPSDRMMIFQTLRNFKSMEEQTLVHTTLPIKCVEESKFFVGHSEELVCQTYRLPFHRIHVDLLTS